LRYQNQLVRPPTGNSKVGDFEDDSDTEDIASLLKKQEEKKLLDAKIKKE
jgi:hypothetical protein